MTIDRRSLLGLLGAGAALPSDAVAQPIPASVSFLHGVASGDPSADGAVLWTRVTPPAEIHRRMVCTNLSDGWRTGMPVECRRRPKGQQGRRPPSPRR